LAFFRHGFVVGDWDKPQEAHRFAEGIDLINAPFQFVGDSNDAQELAMEAGIADTALERLTMKFGRSVNTVPLFAAASAQGVPILTVTADQKPALDGVFIPPAIKTVLAGELTQGQMLILPSRLVKLNDVQTYGWWSIDPETGMALGKMELGGAQGMVETAQMHERIEKWTEIFAKFYGGLLQCYMLALGENLGGLETLETGHLKHHAPGESPLPDADKLASCVIEKGCEAIAELMAEATTSVAFAKEAAGEIKSVKRIMAEWAGATAYEKGAGYGFGKACEEAAAKKE
jgi:hypothetical protein